MNEVKLGALADEHSQRDAIHIAVAPVVAAHDLLPGTHVGLNGDGQAEQQSHSLIGVVDPFLHHGVRAGQRFHLMLYPNTITGLRHEWTHPSFAQVGEERALSEAWLREFCNSVGERYEYVMKGADTFVRTSRSDQWPTYLFGETHRGALEGVRVPDEFWKHYEVVRGERVESKHRKSFFTCSC